MSLTVRKTPCPTCPYRRDVPSGIWHESEYAKLPGYDGDYASAVVDALTADFPALNDPVTAEIVREHVSANARVPGSLVEVIVDDVRRANWRLVGAPHDRRRVHLGCWKLHRSDADCERWARLNAALDALEVQ